ncbi:kinase-like domain-containing protein [Lasiosphaeris hirsuta]|uniref:non-specific serine/threonine protein kinase n=1 Tax=Lasiosphaeris hirsuta TaxID=260670 RepID=A0AA40AGY1_9PEZI|nr:kinase-like domain-containing protein [Lasiosphaeris hirsuta]
MATTTPESNQRQQEALLSVDQGKDEAGKTPIHYCCPSFATPTQLRRLGPTAASRVKQSQRHVPRTDIDFVALLGRIENATSSTDTTESSADQAPAVRFKSTIEEIAPDDTSAACHSAIADAPLGDPGEVTPEQIRDLTKRLKACPLQERRMNIFSYEAFSLPPSRTVSHEEDSREPSREATRSSVGRNSPILPPSLRHSEMQTPPLTPAGTGHAEGDLHSEHAGLHDQLGRSVNIITPQDSSHEPSSPAPATTPTLAPFRPVVQRVAASAHVEPQAQPQRPASSDGDHRRGLFSVGAGSRESSPSRSAAASQFYTRYTPPQGDANDPYAANRRQAQKGIDSRFIFSRKKKPGSPSSSTATLPRCSTDTKPASSRKADLQVDDGLHSRTGSMVDLKRFFKLGPASKAKRVASPATSAPPGRKTPPARSSQIPFGDDHGLTSKYGKLGKVLGAGAGGSVRLMKRGDDGVVFAVKEFRPRHSYETEREYVKKLTAEYCMGSSLHHGNIIETLDIVQEKGKWYEVMEYAPFDLFAIVMTGKMSREEVSCCFLQILSGVTYLHSMGLAHRDLKLDNVVVSEHGIMKIIDFGSSHVYKYPFESGLVLASGIVGSDPYLAPEVYDERKYDPQAVDIWSLAIIYCCMTLRRFPWKVPRMSDSSFKLFAAEPSPGHDPKKLMLPPSQSMSALSDLPARDFDPATFRGEQPEHKAAAAEDESKVDPDQKPPGAASNAASTAGDKKEVVRGPWRILRLLPRESRHIIGRMLELDPKKRAKMSEILDDPWVANTVICTQHEGSVVVSADDHKHILEPPSSATASGK